MQDKYSRVYYTLEYKNGQESTTYNKEEFFQELNFRNLKKLHFYLSGDSKNLSIYIYISNDSDSEIKITSNDKVRNRGTVTLFKEIIEKHEKKINKLFNKRVGKLLVSLFIVFLIFIIYFTFLDIQNSVINLITMIINFFTISYWGSYLIAYLFPKIEHSEMLRVKIRKYLVITLIPVIAYGLLVNGLYDLLKP